MSEVVKISELPAAVSAGGTDQVPANQGGTTRRITNAQLATFIQTALSLLQLVGGKISLNNDGSASFANGGLTIAADGAISFSAGNASILATGEANLAQGVLSVSPTGAIALGPNSIAANGDFSVNLQNLLNADGSVSFAGGNVTISSGGQFQITATIVLDTDGSVSLASGAVTVTAAGDVNAPQYLCNGQNGITSDFAIEDGGVPKTFHFEGGILTGVT